MTKPTPGDSGAWVRKPVPGVGASASGVECAEGRAELLLKQLHLRLRSQELPEAIERRVRGRAGRLKGDLAA